jgi:hypothetical protein
MPFNKIKINSLENSSITTEKIQNNAVTTGKVGPSAATAVKLNADVITGLTELNETANDADFVLIYDTSTSSFKKILKSYFGDIVPTISSITPTNVFSTDSSVVTFTITGTGFNAGTVAKLIGSDGSILNFDTVIRNSTTQLTTTLSAGVLSLSEDKDPYSLQVIGGTGLSAVLSNQVNVDQSPTFINAAGTLGTFTGNDSVSVYVEATDPESAGAVTFELLSGSLPTGLSLNQSTGQISGTATNPASDTTSSFTIRAKDVLSNVSLRDFSITINRFYAYQSFTSSGTFSVPSGTSAVDVLVVAGGGSGGFAFVCTGSSNPGPGQMETGNGGGGGAGGLIFRPGFSVTPGGTVSVTVGDGGQDSVFGTLTAKAGGGGGIVGANIGTPAATPGGSGGGASQRCTVTIPGRGTFPGSSGSIGTATQPTQPGDSGTYGFGNAGGGYTAPGSASGGGGGSGAIGSNNSTGTGGNGGVGRSYTIADGTTPVFYAGGGGGAGASGLGQGGQGGGGSGSSGGGSGQAGQANKGGGGGGNREAQTAPIGGKGIVIVKY